MPCSQKPNLTSREFSTLDLEDQAQYINKKRRSDPKHASEILNHLPQKRKLFKKLLDLWLIPQNEIERKNTSFEIQRTLAENYQTLQFVQQSLYTSENRKTPDVLGTCLTAAALIETGDVPSNIDSLSLDLEHFYQAYSNDLLHGHYDLILAQMHEDMGMHLILNEHEFLERSLDGLSFEEEFSYIPRHHTLRMLDWFSDIDFEKDDLMACEDIERIAEKMILCDIPPYLQKLHKQNISVLADNILNNSSLRQQYKTTAKTGPLWMKLISLNLQQNT